MHSTTILEPEVYFTWGWYFNLPVYSSLSNDSVLSVMCFVALLSLSTLYGQVARSCFPSHDCLKILCCLPVKHSVRDWSGITLNGSSTSYGKRLLKPSYFFTIFIMKKKCRHATGPDITPAEGSLCKRRWPVGRLMQMMKQIGEQRLVNIK